MINIDPGNAELPAVDRAVRTGAPGVYAQEQFEQARQRERLRKRALLPTLVAVSILMSSIAFFAGQRFGVNVASLVAVAVGLLFVIFLFRLPAESLLWAKGVVGERKAASVLEPLIEAGYVALYGRQIPGRNGDIDCMVIGPTGVFQIETKNWSGKVEVRNDRLFVGDRERTWVIAQVYREALAVQLALSDELTARRVTVTPVLCAIGGVANRASIAGGVHVVDGKRLARLLVDRPVVFDDEAVQTIARLADQRFRLPYAWEVA